LAKVRFFQVHHEALRALQNNGGIEVIVGVGNDELQKISSDQAAANGWVNDNIRQFYPTTNIKYIAVGNKVLSIENRQHLPYLIPAMRNIQTTVRSANMHNSIKVSTTHATSVLGNSHPPSHGEFTNELKSSMSAVLNFLAENGSPFMANVYPYFSYNYNKAQISLDYALFRSSDPVVNDGGRLYKSLFDALVDSLISAMERSGHPDIPIVITESGWPSAGNEAATVENAKTYNNNLIKHVLSNAGTPKRPGRHIESYIFALFNENLKGGDETERHFGLFYPDQNPVYPVNFSP
jgi:exo-beta-1,3-glucanase (GH17 family)